MNKPSHVALLIAALAIAFAPLAFAQAAVTTNEFPRSDVVTLLDETFVEVGADGSFSARRHVRTKVLTDRGRRAGDTIIPFNSSHQDVELRFAKSTAPDGTVSEVKPDQMQRARPHPGHPAYSDVEMVGYRVPKVQVGSVLDQEYVLTSKPLMGDHFWMIWRIRSAQPVLETQLVLKIPAGRTFQWKIHNADVQPQITDSPDKKWKTYTWKHSSPKEYEGEPYMPSVDELFPWMEISTVANWHDVAKWLDEITNPQIDSSEEIAGRARVLIAGLPKAEDKIAALYHWIEDNFKFVQVDLAQAAYKPRKASQVYPSRYGDAKDLSTLLAAMLRDAGVTARLAFLESGRARKIGELLPTPRHLTHCIVVAEADGKRFYLDPSAETARHDVILGRLCNTELLVVGKGANRLVESPRYDRTQHGTRERATLRLSADGSIRGELTSEFLGESDAFMRAAVKYTTGPQLDRLMDEAMRKNIRGGELVRYDTADVSDRSRNYSTKYEFVATQWADVADGRLRFKPQLAQDAALPERLFARGERDWPFLFYDSAPASSEVEIVLPDGWKVESSPKDIEIDNAFSYWKRTLRQEGNRLFIGEVSYIKTARLPREALKELRAYYEDAIARRKEEVVLSRK